MKAAIREWIEKAEGDYATMEREWRARKNRNLDAVCFHAQQCAEKYLKAKLDFEGVSFGKTHDLDHLLALVLPYEPTWELLRPDLAYLTEFAVIFRYPGESADYESARTAKRMCKRFRRTAREAFRLKD